MISPISVKSKLTNHADLEKRLFSEVLVSYAIERMLYRISVSKYNTQFVLKGGVLLYGLFDSKYPRSTSDIDLLGLSVDHSFESIKRTFIDILRIVSDDGLVFDLDSLYLGKISEATDNPGFRIKCLAYLDKTRIPVSIDIGFEDIIYPDSKEMSFPTILQMDSPKILVYPIESIISEKFHAIVSLGKANSRFKDFYDIDILTRSFNISGSEMKKSLMLTFNKRNTGLIDIIAFNDEFFQNELKLRQWKGFLNKKNIDSTLDLAILIGRLREFFVPILLTINKNEVFDYDWLSSEKKWVKKKIENM